MLHGMKRLGLLAIALALGCNATSDGDTDTDGNSGGGSSAAETEDVPTETATATESDSANTESASGATTDGTSSSTGDASSGEESSSSGSGSDSGSSSTGGTSGSSSSSTGDLGPQDLCEATDGTWEPAACGDYVCGIPNACEAIIPGCDCGQDANFVEGEGCVPDDACATFDCGDELECLTVAQYCLATFPGVKGAPITYECLPMPDACAASIDCVCLAAELMLPPPPVCNEPVPDGLVVQIFLP